MERTGGSETEAETVSDAMSIILAIPGNLTCADCSSSGIYSTSCTHTHISSSLSPPQLWSGPVLTWVWCCVSSALVSTGDWVCTCLKSDLSIWTSGTDTPSTYLPLYSASIRSLSLCLVLQFMVRQGNKKANCYYEATLGTGAHASVRKPTTLSTK